MRSDRTLAICLLAGLSGCEPCSNPHKPAGLGVESDLHDVVHIDTGFGERDYDYLAVGAGGTVVVWGRDFTHDNDGPNFIETFDLGDTDLRGAWIDESSWWVVGDSGLIAVTDDQGENWQTFELPSHANLHAIAGHGGRPFVIGDAGVVVRSATGTWSEVPAPTGEWGQLRGLYAHDTGYYVVGLGGVIWSTSDPGGTWILEPSGVTADLVAISHWYPSVIAVGAAGTMLIRDQQGWTPADTGVDVDLVDIVGGRVLGANGDLHQLEADHSLTLIDSIPDALALTYKTHGWVGKGGASWSGALVAECD